MLSGGTLSDCAMAGTAVFKIVVSRDSMKNPTATSHGSRRLAVALAASASGSGKRGVYDALSLRDEAAQMSIVAEALGVNLVDVFRYGLTGRNPAAVCCDFHPADRGMVARRMRE